MAPFIDAGRADLVELGYRITMNLTADFAGIDRPEQTPEETEALLDLVMKFSEGATLVHSTRDHDEVRAEVRAALIEMEKRLLAPSIDRRRDLLSRFEAGELSEAEIPRDAAAVSSLLSFSDVSTDRVPINTARRSCCKAFAQLTTSRHF